MTSISLSIEHVFTIRNYFTVTALHLLTLVTYLAIATEKKIVGSIFSIDMNHMLIIGNNLINKKAFQNERLFVYLNITFKKLL